jgi:predicted nucleotidyltransferase
MNARKQTMIELVRQHKDELIALCRTYGIRKLGVFGSAATGNFVAGTSDIDFILEFLVSDPGIADRLLDFAEEAESLLGASVDIVIESSISNPYLRHAVDQSREAIFDGDSNRQAAA